jgi:hypothetical protein
MQALGLDVTNAVERVRKGKRLCALAQSGSMTNNCGHPAHEPMWLTPNFHEQLILFPLCGYMPAPGVSQYEIWRTRCSRR